MKLLAPDELPHLRRQGRRPGAEGSGGPARPPGAAAADLSGTVKPLAAGTTVELQQLLDGSWSTVLEATSDEAGRFVAVVPEPGVYRARTAPAQGFAEGLSGQLEVP